MWILGLEAGGALCLLVFIVWWTMYSGREPEQSVRPRKTGRQTGRQSGPPDAPADQDAPGS